MIASSRQGVFDCSRLRTLPSAPFNLRHAINGKIHLIPLCTITAAAGRQPIPLATVGCSLVALSSSSTFTKWCADGDSGKSRHQLWRGVSLILIHFLAIVYHNYVWIDDGFGEWEDKIHILVFGEAIEAQSRRRPRVKTIHCVWGIVYVSGVVSTVDEHCLPPSELWCRREIIVQLFISQIEMMESVSECRPPVDAVSRLYE